MMNSNRIIFLILCTLLSLGTVSVILLSPTVSFAKTTEKSLQKKLDKATSLYDDLEIEQAEDVLTDTIADAASNNISGLTVAKLHMMLGIIRFANTGEDAQAEEQFVEALLADPSIEIPDVYRTPILEKILKKARTKVPANSDTTTGVNNITQFLHEALSIANAGEALKLNVEVPTEMPVFKIFVNFRRFEESTFQKFEMIPASATNFSVEIPGTEIRTSQIDYFITAEDRAGQVIARSGDDTTPHNIVVMGSGDLKTTLPPEPETPAAPSSHSVYADLSVGTGVGFLTGGENNTPTANPTRDVTGGLAFAFAHANVGFGAILGENMHLGLEFRLQFAPTQDINSLTDSLDTGSGFWDTEVPCFGTGAPLDCMARLKYKYFFTDSIFYSTVGAGIGRARNWLRLKSLSTQQICENRETQTDSSGNQYCFIRDTVRTGWFHFGLGGGMAFPITDSVAFYMDAFLMILAPETSINLDLQGGMQFKF